MTTKQFKWLRNHQPISVQDVEAYDCKKPKNYHYLSRMQMEFNGEYFVFKGVYYTFFGNHLQEHFGRFKIHYKNVRKLTYYKVENKY